VSLLTVIQDAADLLGLPRPGAVVSSTSTQVRQLLAHANIEGGELARRHQWQALTLEATWTSTAAEDQGALTTLAPGFVRAISDTVWNRSDLHPVPGPLTPQIWQSLKASGITGPYFRFRIRAGRLLLIPAPAAGESLAFEYLSNNWCQSSAGTGQTRWNADDDTGVLDENLMTQGIVWRFKKSKGLDYVQEFQDYELAVSQAIMADGARGTISLDNCPDMVPGVIVPEGSWNL
jgi:hypothetical protein